MKYTFTETDSGKIILKTMDTQHTILTGWQEFITEYADSIISDKFFVIRREKSTEDSEGNCYDWYTVSNRYRQIDRTAPIAASVKELEDAMCEADAVNAQRMADIEDAMCEQDIGKENL